jgi:hypothetical protein
MNKLFGIAAVLALFALAGIGIAKIGNANIAQSMGPGDALDDFGCRTEWAILHPGDQSGPMHGISIRLADVGVAQGPDNDHPAIYDVLNRRGTVLSQVQVLPGHVYSGSYQGKNYYISTLRTAPGFTFDAKWSEQLFTVCRQ